MSWTSRDCDPHSDEWRVLLSGTAHLLFHTPEWSDVLREGVSSRTFCWLLEEDGEPKAGLLGSIVGGYGLSIAHPSFPYGGIIGSPPPAERLRELLLPLARRTGCCQLQLVDFPYSAKSSLAGAAMREDETNMLLLSNHDEETLWQSYRRAGRQDINKARKLGVHIDEASNQEGVEALYSMYLETMERTGGIARYKKQLLQAIVDRLASSKRVHLSLAIHEGKPIAGLLAVDSAKLTHGLLLVGHSSGRSLGPNKLLLHTAAEAAMRRGLDAFDFMPSGQSSSGVNSFKKLWRAEAVPLTHQDLVVRRVRSSAWNLAYTSAGRWPFRELLARLRRRT